MMKKVFAPMAMAAMLALTLVAIPVDDVHAATDSMAGSAQSQLTSARESKALGVSATGSKPKSVKVRTQKQLTKALKTQSVDSITIVGDAEETFTIPKADFSDKQVVLNAESATLSTKATLSSVSVKSGEALVVRGEVDTVKVADGNVDVDVSAGANVSTLKVTKPGVDLDVNKKAEVTKINVKGANASVDVNAGANVGKLTVSGVKADIDFNAKSVVSEAFISGDRADIDFGKKSNVSDASVSGDMADVDLLGGSRVDSLAMKGADDRVDVGKNAEVKGIDVVGKKDELVIRKGASVDDVSVTGKDARIGLSDDSKVKATEGIVAVVGGESKNTDIDLDGNAVYSSILNRSQSAVELGLKDGNIKLNPGEAYSMDNPESSNDSKVSDSNPLKRFSGMVRCGQLSLEIHGSGSFASMSSNARVHGWYHNLTTNTDYECWFIINGANIAVQHIENERFESNYLGEAAFRIVNRDEDSLTIASSNAVYGDKGVEYEFIYPSASYQSGHGGEAVCVDNPLRIFNGGTNSSNGIWLEIHGTGVFASMSYGSSIHGWYHNEKTGTNYECRFEVDGNNIAVTHIDNVNYESRYLGEAAFELVGANSNSVTLRSANNVYGDKGASYTFFTQGGQPSDADNDNAGEPVSGNNPLRIFSGGTDMSNGLWLEIHGKGALGGMSHGDTIHGWYHNTNVGVDYECFFEVDGSSVTAVRTENKTYERGYRGNATFKLVSSDAKSITLRSTSNIYSDKGTVYTFAA